MFLKSLICIATQKSHSLNMYMSHSCRSQEAVSYYVDRLLEHGPYNKHDAPSKGNPHVGYFPCSHTSLSYLSLLQLFFI